MNTARIPAFHRHVPKVLGLPRWTWITAFLSVLTLAFATRSFFLIGLTLGGSAWLLLSHLSDWSRASVRERAASLLIVLLLSLWLPIAAWREPAALAHYCVVLLALAIAYVLSRDLQAYRRSSGWLLAVSLAGVAAYLISTGLDDFPLENILPNSSSNGITSYLIVLQANYCIARYLTTGRPSLVSPILTLLVCVVGYGRGSLLAAAAIIVINLCAFLDWRNPMRTVALLVLALVAVSWVKKEHGDGLTTFVETNTKIGAGLVDDHREQQISEYLDRIDSLTLVTGVEYSGTSIASAYNNNPHNSYIRAHHIFGLPYLVLMLAFPLLLVSWRLTAGTLVVTGSLLAVILFRAFTEPILFPTLLDVFYFACCFALGRPAGSAPKASRL